MQLRYRSVLDRRFPWLQVDFSGLRACAAAAGYDTELLARARIGSDYLARLTLKTQRLLMGHMKDLEVWLC
jgi:hypothetical protein